MKKNILNFLLILILMFFCYQLLINSNSIKSSILITFDLWKNNLFPYLFPFFIISDLLINLNFIEIINKYLNPLMYKLFKINSSSSFILIMSTISGIPSNAKYINSLLLNNSLSEYEAQKIILFSHFCNPLFIMGMIANVLNKKLAILILCSHYITNIIIGLIFREFHSNNCKRVLPKKTTNSFLKTLSNSIFNNINTLLLILGVITFFSCITTIITSYISSPLLKSLISGILEITQGVNQISLLNISLKSKAIIITFIISFGGLSSHMQVMSILENTNIKYIPYLLSRILHSIIASFILYLII